MCQRDLFSEKSCGDGPKRAIAARAHHQPLDAVEGGIQFFFAACRLQHRFITGLPESLNQCLRLYLFCPSGVWIHDQRRSHKLCSYDLDFSFSPRQAKKYTSAPSSAWKKTVAMRKIAVAANPMSGSTPAEDDKKQTMLASVTPPPAGNADSRPNIVGTM